MLKEDILEKFSNVSEPNWPPSSNELKSSKFKPPSSIILFLKTMLTTDINHSVQNNSKISRLVDSFAQDIVYAVTKRTVLQLKHFLLALGLHTLTGSRKVVDLVNKFGHCMSYDLTCEMETAQADVSLVL